VNSNDVANNENKVQIAAAAQEAIVIIRSVSNILIVNLEHGALVQK
jgi:hypothetical protein